MIRSGRRTKSHPEPHQVFAMHTSEFPVDALWYVDARGRVFAASASTGRFYFAYGDTARPPRIEHTQLSGDASRLLLEQRREMWHEVERAQPMLVRLAQRAAPSDPGLAEQLVCDVGVPAACMAVVCYDPLHESRTSLEGWVLATVRKAYRQHLAARSRRRDLESEVGAELSTAELRRVEDGRSWSPEPQPDRGLAARAELVRMGLSEDEVRLLELRIVDGRTLEELCSHLGVNSKQTVKNRIDRILERVRRG